MLADVQHTDAAAIAMFRALPPEDQTLAIWLNGRETNGSVAKLIGRMDHVEPMVNKHERYAYIAAGLFVLFLAATPFLLWVLNHVRWE